MAECEDVIPLENIESCPTDEVNPGVSEVGIYAAAVTDFDKIEEPANLKDGTDLADVATIKESHEFSEDRGFHKVQITSESGMVETENGGEKGNISYLNSVTGALQGTGPKNAGWLRKYKNTPMIFIVKEKNGDVKQIGSELSPAYLIELAGTSGQAAGDVKNMVFKFQDSQNYPAPEYDGTIEEFSEEEEED